MWRRRRSLWTRLTKGGASAVPSVSTSWAGAGRAGFASIQFNAVVESNAPAGHLWRSLGFQIVGTVPESFDHPEHGLVGLHIMYRLL
jgi:hypothetical protein